MIGAKNTTLASQLLDAQNEDDIQAILASVRDAQWQPLGGRRNNFPIVNVGADSADAIVERVTNGIDALIDREVSLRKIQRLESPRQAAEVLFDIPNGRLTNVKTGRRRELAERLRVTLRDSGEKARPTVVVDDDGIGQHPDDFPTTLLSLNENNKVNRPELMGAFGQGGASAFAYSPYSITIARRHPDLRRPGQDDLVGWSIVRFNPLDENFSHGMYEYLVVPDAYGHLVVPRLETRELPEEFRTFVGCRFLAISYQLDRYSDVVFQPKNSLWHLFNTVLFDPVYPLLIRDERPRAIKGKDSRATEGIVVSGNATRLTEDKRDKTEYDNTHAVQLGEGGTATLRYFVLRSTADSKRDWEVMANYIPQTQAVTITLNGQRQGSMRREVFDRMGLMSIGKALIVQVDCDRLTKRAKWELFSTTRDRIKTSPIAAELEDKVRAAIASDKQLRDLDRERKQRALARQSEAEAKRINDWLKHAIQSIKQGEQPVYRQVISTNPEYPLLGNHPLLDEASTSDGGGTPPEEVELSNPPAEPTLLRVLNPTVRVPEGGTGVVRLAMNAPDDYVSPDPGVGKGGFTANFTKGQSLFALTGYSALRRGVLRATIQVSKGVAAGETGRVIFAVTRPTGLPLLAEAEVITVEAPQARVKPAGTKVGPEPGPNVRAVDRQGWLELNLLEDIVARTEEDPTSGTTTIYVFKEYPKLMERLKRDQVAEENVVAYQSKFVAAMALASWLQHEEQKKSETSLDQDVLDAEVRRAAEVFLFSQYVASEKLSE